MRVTESIRILLDAHEHEIAWADGALAATQVSTPTGDLFYAEQCAAGIIKSGRLEDRPGVPHIFSARMIAEFNQRRKS